MTTDARTSSTEFNATNGDPRSVPPLTRHLVIQSDQFCTCGYNLHGQTVERDERLDLPLVRCPECGRYHPAGHGSTALRPWLARLAAFALAAWVVFLLGVWIAVTASLTGLLVAGLTMDAVWITVEMSSGRPIAQHWDPDASTTTFVFLDTGEVTTPKGSRWEMRYVPRSHPWAQAQHGTSTYINRESSWEEYAVFYGAHVAIALVLGIAQAAVMWHLREWRRWAIPISLLLIPVTFLAITVRSDAYALLGSAFIGGTVLQIALFLGTYALGLLIGRPVARFLVTMLIPPRPRQMLAFLWHADAKVVPTT